MNIRRDKSHLHFGPRRNHHPGRLVLYLLTTAVVAVVLIRFDQVQRWVLAQFDGEELPAPDSIVLAQSGERAYFAGDLESAIKYYQQAAEQAPGNNDILFEYGRMLIYRSYDGRKDEFRVQQALDLAEQGVKRAPDNVRAQALLCLALVENDRAGEGIRAGLRAIELNPDYSEAHAYLAMAYYFAGSYHMAEQEAVQAVQLDPFSLDARRALALSLAYAGNFEGAIQQYEQALRIHPHLDVLYFEIAQYYKRRDNYDAAIRSYDQVLAHDPDNVKAFTRKCETYYTMRQDALAEEACIEAIRLDPTYPEAYQQLGKVRYFRKNYEGAVDAFQSCAALQAITECTYFQGLALALLDKCEQAWGLLTTALSMNPDDAEKARIYSGLMMCAEGENFEPGQIPTPIPPTATPPDPL